MLKCSLQIIKNIIVKCDLILKYKIVSIIHMYTHKRHRDFVLE